MRRITESLVSFVSWHRRAVGALLAVLAVLTLGHSLALGPPTTAVVMVTAPIAAGSEIRDGDVAVRDLPTAALPEAAFTDRADVVGQTAAVALPHGTILQPTLLTTTPQPESGRAVVPICVRDPTLRDLLQAGDVISLVAAGGEFVEVVCADARVLTIPARESSGSAVALATGSRDGLILVDVPATDAGLVAALGQDGQLGVVIGRL